jgi:hypothetical protein
MTTRIRRSIVIQGCSQAHCKLIVDRKTGQTANDWNIAGPDLYRRKRLLRWKKMAFVARARAQLWLTDRQPIRALALSEFCRRFDAYVGNKCARAWHDGYVYAISSESGADVSGSEPWRSQGPWHWMNFRVTREAR